MKFAKYVYIAAGIYGLIVLLPMLFAESQIGTDTPPAITHAEYFYGFLGTAIAWQVAFLIIGSDPLKYRLLMLPTLIEKFSFAVTVAWLVSTRNLTGGVVIGAAIDFVLGVLFLISFVIVSRVARAVAKN